MKNIDIFLFIDKDNIIFKNQKFSFDEFSEKVSELRLNKILIIIADWHIFKLKFNLKLKKISEARKAAENHFLYLNPDSTYNPKFYDIKLSKTDEGFEAEVYYMSKEAEEFVEIFFTNNLKNKIINIIPLFELYKPFEKGYIFNDYITIIKEGEIINFHKKDKEFFQNIVSDEEFDSLKEINLNFLENIDIKNKSFDIDFLQRNKSYEVLNKIFYPVVIAIIIINIAIFSFTKYQMVKYKNEFKQLKKINLSLKQQVEPVLKTEDVLKKLKDLNKELSEYSLKIFPFLDFLKNLSKVDKIFVNNMYIRENRLRISGKTKSALKLLEILKKLKYLKDPKIVSNIVRDSSGNERFQIEAKITYGK